MTLLPELFLDAVTLDGQAIRLRRFAGPEPTRTVGLAWRRSNPMAETFSPIAELVACCGDGASSVAGSMA